MSRVFRSAKYTSLALAMLCGLTALSSSGSAFVAAASASCVCANDGTPNEALISASADPSNDCICDCPSGYLPPLCDFASSDQVKVLVLWHNTTAHPFSTIEKRMALQNGLSGSTRMDLLPVTIMPHLIPSDLQTVVDATTNNAGENIVPFLYVITGTYASQLLLDSLKPTASQPTYLTAQLCLGAREVGNKPAPLGRYAQALANSKVMGNTIEIDITISIGSGTSTRVTNTKTILEFTEMDWQFFIATVVVAIGVAILSAIEHCAVHPKSEDGDDINGFAECGGVDGNAKQAGFGMDAPPIADTFKPLEQKQTLNFNSGAPKDPNEMPMASNITYNAGTQVVVTTGMPVGSAPPPAAPIYGTSKHTENQHPFASTDFGLPNSPSGHPGSGPQSSAPSPQPFKNHDGALAAANAFGDGGFGLAANNNHHNQQHAVEMTHMPGQHVEADVNGWYPQTAGNPNAL